MVLLFLMLMCGLSGISRVKAFPRIEEKNVALGAQAVQSSTGYGGPAGKAVDGIPNPNYHSSPCTHTLLQRDPWWRVDLSKTFNITRISITNRGDCCAERLTGAQIHVGDSLENNGNSNKQVAVIQAILNGRTQTYKLHGASGRYVNIFLPGEQNYLTLCEVQVFSEIADERTSSLLPEEAGLRDFAPRGRATQSSLNSSGAWAGVGIPQNAIDGNRDSDLKKGSCSQTAHESSPWWRVNLHRRHTITVVALTNRGDCCSEELDGAEIRIGNSIKNEGKDNPLCDTVSSIPAGQTVYYNCSSMLQGRYVTIVLPREGTLSLCEVEVFGRR